MHTFANTSYMLISISVCIHRPIWYASYLSSTFTIAYISIFELYILLYLCVRIRRATEIERVRVGDRNGEREKEIYIERNNQRIFFFSFSLSVFSAATFQRNLIQENCNEKVMRPKFGYHLNLTRYCLSFGLTMRILKVLHSVRLITLILR